MGLDMYLYKAKKTNHSIEELVIIDKTCNVFEDLEKIKETFPVYESEYAEGYFSIFKQVAYWRKFNALHNWFVTNVQIGIDDCNMYEVTKDHVEDLLDTLMNTKQDQDPSHFEPVVGFFFGSTEIDEYYWEQVENTSDKMYRLLNDFDWENERLFYCSSW